MSLTKKEKEVTWKRFLRILRTEEKMEIVIKDQDDFDPDTYGEESIPDLFIRKYNNSLAPLHLIPRLIHNITLISSCSLH